MPKIARPCACRGFIDADPKDPEDITRAVRDHQRTPKHSGWVAREQLAGNLVVTGSPINKPNGMLLRRVS